MSYYLTVTACLKDEGLDVIEWLEFHKLVGVKRFYLYDNASTDNTRELLQPYIDDGTVVYFYTDMRSCQMACYYNALSVFRHEARWMAFIDLDEFLFCPDGVSVAERLQEYEDYPGVGVSWVIYGSSGHENRPDGLVIENYTRCSGDDHESNYHIKSIVNPKQAIMPGHGPHDFIYVRNENKAIDENFELLNGPWRRPDGPPSTDKLRLNHYFTKSKEDYANKMQRGRADVLEQDPRSERPWSSFYGNDRNEHLNTSIHQYLPALKEKLGIG